MEGKMKNYLQKEKWRKSWHLNYTYSPAQVSELKSVCKTVKLLFYRLVSFVRPWIFGVDQVILSQAWTELTNAVRKVVLTNTEFKCVISK